MRPLALVALIALAGCFSTQGDPVEVREYDLVAPSAPAVAPLRTSSALQVEPFGVSESLERESLVWRQSDVEVGAYPNHRWARPPQQGIRDVVAAALRRAHVATETDPPLPAPDLVLRGHLARCEELDEDKRWLGAIELRVVLVTSDGRELLRKTYSGVEPAKERNPPAVVEALRRLAARLGDELAADTAAAIAARVDER